MSQPSVRVVEHEQAVFTLIGGDILEGGDVMFDPQIGLMQRPVPVDLSELGNKVLRGNCLAPVRLSLDGCRERAWYFVSSCP